MIKKIKFGVIFIGFVIPLMSLFVSRVYARECYSSREQSRCMDGKMWNCSEQGNWDFDYDCDSGMCLLDNINCATSEESEKITNGTFYYPPKNPEYEESGLIPNYPDEVKFEFKDQKIGSIITKLLNYVYVFAGLILLVMLIMGGLGLMTAAGNPDKMKAGYGKITNALIGFLIIFISYFVVQLVETILGIKIM